MELSRLQKGGRAVLIWAKGVRVCGAGLGRGEGGCGWGGGVGCGVLLHLRWGRFLGKGMKTGSKTQNNIL